MCKFMSCISNGKGKVLFFTLKDIEKIEKEGNPNNYEDWNSHTSIADFNGIKGKEEDNWNKWEYDCEKKELKIDESFNAKDDSKSVKKVIEEYLAKENAVYCQKIYKKNSGDSNSGSWNLGSWNSGDRNSGNRNSGSWNSGDSNSGSWNLGNRNSGNRNLGSWNLGDRNSGYLNTDEPQIRIFNKLTKKKDISFPNYFYFDLNVWVNVYDMSEKEKKEFWWYETTEGFLRKIDYKEAWKLSFEKTSTEDVAKTLKLPNFDTDIFFEISGISKKDIETKLGYKIAKARK